MIRNWIANLEYDTIVNAVNAFTDAYESVRGTGASETAARARAADAFRDSLTSITPSEEPK